MICFRGLAGVRSAITVPGSTWWALGIGAWDIPLAVQREAMGIDWMTLEELSEAIPPAYTEFIGAQLITQIPQTSRIAESPARGVS